MIRIINFLFGSLIFIASTVLIQLNISLRRQFHFIKNSVDEINSDAKIHQSLATALVEIEDKRFFDHLGVDFYSIMRAIFKNITRSRLEGASTIVQQLVRTITEERELKMKRKIKEVIFAVLVNKSFTKDEILKAYLNSYRFKNSLGIVAFCKLANYDIDDLTINEIAQIVARFKYPSINNRNYVRYLKRVRTVEIRINKLNDIFTSTSLKYFDLPEHASRLIHINNELFQKNCS